MPASATSCRLTGRLQRRPGPPSGGTMTSNCGGSRGLEGFSDLSYQVKVRAFSATGSKGDYTVCFFLDGSVPTGSTPNGLGHTVLSPTLAAGKGLGPWGTQSTNGTIFW